MLKNLFWPQKRVEAKKVLIKLRGTDDVLDEIDDMEAEAARSQDEEVMSVMELLKSKEVRWQLISICLMMLSQQLSGLFCQIII